MQSTPSRLHTSAHRTLHSRISGPPLSPFLSRSVSSLHLPRNPLFAHHAPSLQLHSLLQIFSQTYPRQFSAFSRVLNKSKLLFSVPRGFKNFDSSKRDGGASDSADTKRSKERGGEEDPAEPQKDKEKRHQAKDDKFKDREKEKDKDSDKEDDDESNDDFGLKAMFGSKPGRGSVAVPLAVVAVMMWAAFQFMNMESMFRTEMSFQEFKQRLLAKGLVDRIVVEDITARVLLRPGAAIEQSGSNLTFQIGSVESFERSMEAAQRELGIDPMDFVPVVRCCVVRTLFSRCLLPLIPSLTMRLCVYV